MDIKLTELSPGFLGYKGASYTADAWNPKIYGEEANNDKDWSGLYIAAEESTAKGYLPDMVENGCGLTYIHKANLLTEVKLITCLDESFKTGDININTLKESLRAKGISVQDYDLLMPKLGELGYLFKCYNNEESEIEIIVPNSLVENIQMCKYKICELKQYEIINCSTI